MWPHLSLEDIITLFYLRKLQVQVGHLPLVTDSAEGNICDQGCRSRQAA
jgi:hypothetical protein